MLLILTTLTVFAELTMLYCVHRGSIFTSSYGVLITLFDTLMTFTVWWKTEESAVLLVTFTEDFDDVFNCV